MNLRPLIYIGLFIGSIIGSFIPTIWNASILSMSSIVFGLFGAMIGMWLGFKIATY